MPEFELKRKDVKLNDSVLTVLVVRYGVSFSVAGNRLKVGYAVTGGTSASTRQGELEGELRKEGYI